MTVTPQEEAIQETYDASDPEQVQKRKSKAGRKRKVEVDVVGALMADRNGRAWLYGLLEMTHIYESCFTEGRADATAFLLGERNVGLRILADMQNYPELFMQLMQERINGSS